MADYVAHIPYKYKIICYNEHDQMTFLCLVLYIFAVLGLYNLQITVGFIPYLRNADTVCFCGVSVTVILFFLED